MTNSNQFYNHVAQSSFIFVPLKTSVLMSECVSVCLCVWVFLWFIQFVTLSTCRISIHFDCLFSGSIFISFMWSVCIPISLSFVCLLSSRPLNYTHLFLFRLCSSKSFLHVEKIHEVTSNDVQCSCNSQSRC